MLKKYWLLFLFLFIGATPLHLTAKHRKTHITESTPSIKVKHRDNTGMFTMFSDVLYALWEFENGHVQGLNVDFGTEGLYYEADYGPNWWNYYCEPIVLGNAHTTWVLKEFGKIPEKAPWKRIKDIPREEMHRLICSHIHPKKHIAQKVNQFFKQHLKGYRVMGVHYRGTDKKTESPRVLYKVAFTAIQEQIDAWAREDSNVKIKIFIATDEKAFITRARQVWADSVCCQDAIRSLNEEPIHLKATSTQSTHSPYRLGEEAIIDMLLLAKTDFLIRTSSNLGLWSTYFNPHLPVVELSRYYHDLD